jgi:fatty-acyl-CoA synthase
MVRAAGTATRSLLLAAAAAAWAVTALGATHVCLRRVEPEAVVERIRQHKVTHFCGAPIVLRTVIDGAKALGVERFEHPVKVSVAAAPPSPLAARPSNSATTIW